ncbi:MAG: universal stress protein [Cytophagales bacterium]|nr:universal stress protein [Cytophagales bacterium]
MFRTLLVPTDLSANAAGALPYAVRLAQAVGAARIIFFHANDRYLPTSTPVRLYHELTEDMIQAGLRALEAYVRGVLEAEGLVFDQSYMSLLVRNEGYFDVIEEVMRHEQPDLIVMGTQGATGLKKYVLGSNTVKTLNLAASNVLAVPNGCAYPAGHRLLYATDLKLLDREAGPVTALAAALSAPLTVFHFYDPGQSEEPEPVDAGQLTSRLREHIPYPLLSLLLKPVLPGGDTGKLMQAVVKEQQASLLVMFARHKNWIERLTRGSHTGEAFYASQVPVLAFKSS